MVNRTPKPMVTRRSASDLKSKRPKRNISPKNLDDSVSGLSWREERELKKALYASLQEQRRQSRDDKPEDEEEATSLSSNKPTLFYSQSRSSLSSLADSKFVDDSSCSRDSFVVNKESARQEAKKAKYHAQRKFAANTFTPIHSEPLSLGAADSRVLSLSYQKKIRAQRKFAGFGSSRSTSLETPSKPKLKVSPVKLFPVRPKTEDFLTYLCFRGTSVLPPHMDLMNIQKEEENDLSTSNGRAGFTRDSSPASSSSMSHQNEDSMDVPEFPVKMQTPNRKAARASASTPETARGFANLNGRSSKTSPLVGSKLSPTSRRRLTDSYTKGGKVVGRSPGKGHLADRLVLKRKAMATLTAARRISPKKQESGKKLKRSASDGELLKKKDDDNQKETQGNWTNPLKPSQRHTTNQALLPDDSGICTSFHEPIHERTVNYSSPEQYTEVKALSVNSKPNGRIKKSEIFYEESMDPIETLRHEESDGQPDAFISSLFYPLESDLDESLDIAMEFDISLNESLDVNEILTATAGSELTSTPVLQHATSKPALTGSKASPALKSAKTTPNVKKVTLSTPVLKARSITSSPARNGVEATHLAGVERELFSGSVDVWCNKTQSVQKKNMTNRQECVPAFGANLFKPSFETLRGPRRRTSLRQLLATRPVTRSITMSLTDHAYSKPKLDVKFKIKTRTHQCQPPSQENALATTSLGGSKYQKVLSDVTVTCNQGYTSKHRRQEYSTKAATSGGGKKSLSINRQTGTNSKTSNTHKRKSTGNIRDLVPSPAKKKKLRTSQRVKSLLKTRSSKVVKKGSKHRAKYLESLETHPRKRLSTTSSGAPGSATVATKVKKTFKPHRPMTRAASHMKSALKAAKLAANKKLKLVSRALPSSKASPSSKEYSALSKIVERKRKDSISGSDKKRKKLSIESTSSKSSIGSNSNSSTSTVSIEKPSETTSSPPVSYPGDSDAPSIVECPTYYPTDEQFRDPIVYIQSIQGEAEQYGMCKIVPPNSWKMESREIEEFRFTTHVQYIHKMFHKWSPITEQLEYMKKLHKSSGPDDFVVPQIGGVEIDLVKLYELVQKYGGMKGTVGKEKKYMKIAESMRIPKQADRVSKLYAAYCKYLLPYETLLDEETEKLAETVQQDRLRQEKDRMKSPPPCYKSIHKGKSQLLSAYNRAARNIQSLYGAETAEEIEANYWEIVTQSDDHVSVQGATLDTSIYGSMFPVRRDNVYARHGWNLHNFVESKGSILHHLGLIAGVTVPTLHIGMLYSTKCFSCNQHNLPTVQYLHQGDGLVWYAVPNHESGHLKTALKKLMPKHVRDTGFCLQQNAFMVPPSKLVDKGVSVSQCVQNAREFVVVFPSVNYSNISLGHNMAESVHYGTQDWIPDGYHAAELLGVNHDIEMFSMDAMLVFLARDQTTPDTTLALLLPCLEKVVDREITERKALCEAGLKETERLEDKLDKQAKPAQKTDALEEIVICDTSNKICYLSMVLNSHENSAFSLEQGLLHLQKKKNLKHCKLMYRYSDEELKSLLRDVKNRLRGSNSSTPIRGSNPPTPVKGANSTSSLKGSNPSSPVKGVNYTTPVVRGSNPSTPVKGVNYTTPVRGSNPSTPVKGSNSSTPPSTSSPKRKTRKSMTDRQASPASSTSSK